MIADSLAYHGPDRPYVVSEPRLWPNIAAAALGDDVEVDLLARLGWTTRDAWWAVTKDPRAWGELLPRADALVLGVGGMDQLPAAIPTYLREGIAFVRPASARRRVRQAYLAASPRVIAATGGRMRQLPQKATDHYLGRITSVVRHFNPDLPVVLLGPGPHNSPAYPSHRNHPPAVQAAKAWALGHNAEVIELDPLVGPSLADGSANPDGIHYSWRTHQLVGTAIARAIERGSFVERTTS